ncbi:hypothetical protein COD86_28095 [Bacillus cereus]|nr:hypothetical protein COD14_26435 [Bacillus cereus]PGV89605.1 hypothetical protein COD86_28095 [Bacillus cereus]
MKNFLKVLLVLIMFSNALPLNVIKAAQIFGMEYITNVDILDGNGNPKREFSIHDNVKVKYKWEIPNDKDFYKGDQMTIQVPQELKIPGVSEFDVYTPNGVVQANAITDPNNNTVTLTFTKEIEKSNVHGDLELNLNWNEQIVKAGSHVPVVFTKNSSAIPVQFAPPSPPAPTGPPGPEAPPQVQRKDWHILKSYEKQDPNKPEIINWIVKMNGKMHKINNAVFTDFIEENHELVAGSISFERGKWGNHGWIINGNATTQVPTEEKNLTITPRDSNGKQAFSIRLGDLDEEGVQVRYQTRILDGFKAQKYTNTAQLKGTQYLQEDTKDYKSTFSATGTGSGELGALKILKVDADDPNKYLEGAEFKLVDKINGEEKKITTDKDGSELFKDLKYRKYLLTETKAPKGYELNTAPQEIEISESTKDKPLEIKVPNKLMRGSIEVFKVDADKEDKPLAGVEFTLLDENKTPIGKPKLTDENGKVSFDNLPYGTYYLKETKTIEGYNLKQETVLINVNNQVVNHTVTNKLIHGNVELLKVDTENKDAKLEGAEFELHKLHNSNNEIINTYTTDKNGKLVINNLEFGTYELIETVLLQSFNS